MITLASALTRENVDLRLSATTLEGAIEHVAALLRKNPAVVAFDPLLNALKEATPCAAERGCEFAVCIPHARTPAVSSMVMSAGRSEHGIQVAGCPHPIRYIFCIGLPSALNADYLRIVGLLARIFKEPQTELQLRQATTPSQFVQSLARLESKL